MTDEKKLQVTSGKAWRKTELVELPSGKVARLRRLDLVALIVRGQIPDPLTEVVSEMIEGKRKEITIEDIIKNSKSLKSIYDLTGAVCQAVFIEPKVVAKPRADDEISVEDVSLTDRIFVFAWCQSEAVTLENFREEQAEAVADILASEDVRDKTEPDTDD